MQHVLLFFLGGASLPEAAKMEPFPMLDILSLYNRNKKPPLCSTPAFSDNLGQAVSTR